MKRIVQHAVIKVIQPQVVEYTCDFALCGKVCGTRENPKITACGPRGEAHYCKKTGCWHASAEHNRRPAAEQRERGQVFAALLAGPSPLPLED